ncbi:hypothetical protein B0T21DRAFT_449243 [Apiosordaria backusii]|uniref:DUF7779 domain-containing protein n=1 Tax=Apiosordaria backusii TaxID=314023 RepID=A0AA40BRP5_9PEZI|nr:hypothetical protein B0T21DRAFT_449243 [Apiosordaria backusii]
MSLAKAISMEVDGLPLLLVGLGGFMSQSYTSLGEILDTLQRARFYSSHIFSNNASSSAAFQYERPLQLVFQLSLDRLPEAARRVIRVMALLSPEEIPESLFTGKKSLASAATTTNSGDPKLFANKVQQSLASRHLTETQMTKIGVVYSMHRSVQTFILSTLSINDGECQAAFDEAVEVIYNELPKPSPIMVPLFEQRDLFATYIPHAISIHNIYACSEMQIRPTVRFAELICSTSAYLYEHGMTWTKSNRRIVRGLNELGCDSRALDLMVYSLSLASSAIPEAC